MTVEIINIHFHDHEEHKSRIPAQSSKMSDIGRFTLPDDGEYIYFYSMGMEEFMTGFLSTLSLPTSNVSLLNVFVALVP